ncbi:MAG TPA: hypothetical protein VGH38_14460 [Bryobacteraceae bacterium]
MERLRILLDTRHSCSALLHVQGADPFIIQTVLGQSQLSTTRRYTHGPVEVTEGLLKSAARAAPSYPSRILAERASVLAGDLTRDSTPAPAGEQHLGSLLFLGRYGATRRG